jgi:hypothetical protein
MHLHTSEYVNSRPNSNGIQAKIPTLDGEFLQRHSEIKSKVGRKIDATLCHLSALAIALLLQRTSVGEVFLPTCTTVSRNSISIIADGAHKFLQCD